MKISLKGLVEYVALLPTIMSNADKILEATINQVKGELGMLPEEAQQEIVRRRLICATCPFNSSNAVKDGYVSNRFDEHCTMCGCTIARKTSSLSSPCGIACCNPESTCECQKTKLKQYNTEHNIILEPKWLAFKNQEDEQESKNSD